MGVESVSAAPTPTIGASITLERANKIVEDAAKEADDVSATMATDGKKPKTMKPATKEIVKGIVRSGDPGKVLQYIKANKKEFVSGTYGSVFMSAVRKKMGGDDSVGPAAHTPAAGVSQVNAGGGGGAVIKAVGKKDQTKAPAASVPIKSAGGGGVGVGKADAKRERDVESGSSNKKPKLSHAGGEKKAVPHQSDDGVDKKESGDCGKTKPKLSRIAGGKKLDANTGQSKHEAKPQQPDSDRQSGIPQEKEGGKVTKHVCEKKPDSLDEGASSTKVKEGDASAQSNGQTKLDSNHGDTERIGGGNGADVYVCDINELQKEQVGGSTTRMDNGQEGSAGGIEIKQQSEEAWDERAVGSLGHAKETSPCDTVPKEVE